MEAVLEQADRIAFGTDRRVEVSLGLLQRVPSEEEQDEGRTILYARRWKGPQDLATVNVDLLAHISQHIGDPGSDRELRIVRALRWLRRATLANDEVEEFAIMMMGLDGLKSLLPQPPAKSQGKKKGRGRQPSSKPWTCPASVVLPRI